MLSKVFEWSRVTTPNPDDDFVAKRRATVQSLADELPKKAAILADCACAAAGGVVPRFGQDSDLVTTLVDAIRHEQPAYPQALAENQLDLRVVCALVIGEVAEREVNGKNAPSVASQIASTIVLAGLSNKPTSRSKHLQSMIADLLVVCFATAKRASELRRRRWNASAQIDAIAEPTDLPAFWKDAKANLQRMAQLIEGNAALDREEIDTLWWAYNGVSGITGRSFADMPIGEAALCAGYELAGLILPLPLPNTKHLTARVLTLGRKPADLQERPMRDLVAEWQGANSSRLLPATAKTAEFVRANAAIFPLTSTCLRLEDSSLPSASELKRLSGWDFGHKSSPMSVAIQAFDEKVAQRVHETAFPS